MPCLNLAAKATAGHLLGSRKFALPIRDELVLMLDHSDSVVVDFEGTNPTQSFVDELIGVLVLENGESILSRLVFKNCTEEVKAILHFVVSDRLDQHEATHQKSVH